MLVFVCVEWFVLACDFVGVWRVDLPVSALVVCVGLCAVRGGWALLFCLRGCRWVFSGGFCVLLI